jgi:DNA-binding beta-propeller fold protein YncE
MGVAFDGVSVWVTNFYSKNITRLNTDGSVKERIAMEDGPATVAFAGGFILVVNYGSRSVSQIEPQSGRVVHTFAVGRGPLSLAFDGANIWVANGGSNSVSKVKTQSQGPTP